MYPSHQLVEDLTGKPLKGESWVQELKQELGHVISEEKAAYEGAGADDVCMDDIDLDMRIRIVDGDTLISDTQSEGSFLGTCGVFEKYITERYRK